MTRLPISLAAAVAVLVGCSGNGSSGVTSTGTPGSHVTSPPATTYGFGIRIRTGCQAEEVAHACESMAQFATNALVSFGTGSNVQSVDITADHRVRYEARVRPHQLTVFAINDMYQTTIEGEGFRLRHLDPPAEHGPQRLTAVYAGSFQNLDIMVVLKMRSELPGADIQVIDIVATSDEIV